MGIITAYCTDKGNVKEVNQDALLIKTAMTSIGQIAFIAVCDGMGGLKKGEVASSRMVKYLGRWFQEKLPKILLQGHREELIFDSFRELMNEVNEELMQMGKEECLKMGTTMTALLAIDRQYYVAHVGDTRLYEISDDIRQITKDHTFVAREVELGRMTWQDAQRDPRRNLLLQCIGASTKINPEFHSGQLKNNATYIICCDGFRHRLSIEEIKEAFEGKMQEKLLESRCYQMVDLNKRRMESDNITVVALHYTGEETC